jgi:replicative DNA helicase
MTVLAGGSAGRTNHKRASAAPKPRKPPKKPTDPPPAADARAEELSPGWELMAAWLGLFIGPGQVTEVLAPKHKSHENARPIPVTGFFDSDHLDAAARHALDLSPRSEAVYFMPNAVRPVLLGRHKNKRPSAECKAATDQDVLGRRWAMVDVDAIKEDDGVSASPAELDAALATSKQVLEYLRDRFGFPDPVRCFSGNGFHLFYRVNLPRDDGGLVKRFLEALHALFPAVDTACHNPARLTKVYGTKARKGDEVGDRVHRTAVVLSVPGYASPRLRDVSSDRMGVVTEEMLGAVAAPEPAPAAANGRPAGGPGGGGFSSRLVVPKYLDALGLAYKEKRGDGKTEWVLEECVNDSSHRRKAVVGQFDNGAVYYSCRHKGCEGFGWEGFKAKKGAPAPEDYDPPLGGGDPDEGDDDDDDDGPPGRPAYSADSWADNKTFAESEYPLTWLVEKLMVEGQSFLIGGLFKVLKTSIGLDMGLSLASGDDFLGFYRVPNAVPVAFLSGESGEPVLQETAKRICQFKGLDLASLPAPMYFGFRLPQLGIAADVAGLADGLRKRGVKVLFIDPAYLCMLAGVDGREINHGNMFHVGAVLMGVTEACKDAGCTLVLLHHARKGVENPYQPLGLEDLAFAGFQEWSRQWFLISRRRRFDFDSGLHELWTQAGGSAGQGGQWALDVYEGHLEADFTGRVWEPEVKAAGEAREQGAAAQKLRQEGDDEGKVMAAFRRLLDGGSAAGGVVPLEDVKALSGIPRGKAAAAVARLKAEGTLAAIPMPRTVSAGRPASGLCWGPRADNGTA